jgi:threonylcarbamoyladenosine tRNA methylthiotransferase MtaB
VLGNEEKLKAESYAPPAPDFIGEAERVKVNDIMAIRETALHLVGGLEGRARAFLQVQNGCNHRCTFCIIPYGRGNSRSVPMGEIVQQARHLVAEGYQEIVLTGVDITDYGKDLPGQPSLGQMMRRLLAQVPELPRLRLSSIDVAEVDADLLLLLEHEPRLMPHLHLSLQAGDNMILKRMARRHTREQVLAFCEKARALRPDVVFGADIITGFPTETDAMFENTLELVRAANIIYLHVFPYSEREGTPAAKIPASRQVPVPVRKARAKELRELGEALLADYQRGQVGRTAQAIVEKPDMARTESFAQVRLEIPAEGRVGQVIPVMLKHWNEAGLIGAAL